MQSETQFALTMSGQPFTIPNSLQNSSSLTASYTPTDSTTSYSVAVEGIQLATGETTVLDSLTNETGNSGTRSISLNGVVFDSWRFVATWTGTSQQFSVAATVTSTGAGAAFASNLDLAVVHTAS
jgi:hypothetical protein